MNNIFLSQPDPLLANNTPYRYQDYTQPGTPQYVQMQEFMNAQQKDWVYELDSLVKTLDEATIFELNSSSEYNELSASLQHHIQEEIVAMVKTKLNSNHEVVDNIRKQLEIIKKVKESTQNAQRKNLADLNDYMTNYSHLTFDEYRSLKTKPVETIQTENK